MKVSILRPNDRDWSETLGSCLHDVYHTPAWSELCELSDGGKAFAVLAEDGNSKCLLPLMRKELPEGLWDAASPYGYPGPVVTRDAPRSFLIGAVEAAADFMADLGCVSLFIRLHPILNPTPSVSDLFSVNHGSTFAIDLSLDEQEMWKRTRSGHRSDIRRSQNLGVEVIRDDALEYLEDFVDIYSSTMSRVGASEYYYFPRDYFAALFGESETRELWIAKYGAEVIGGSIFLLSSSSGIVEYHLSATAEAGLRLQPSKLIIESVRRAHRDSGFRWLHLGGGVGGQSDSLMRFKSGFGGVTFPYSTIRIATKPDEYRRLTGAVELQLDGFFPLYRRTREGSES